MNIHIIAGAMLIALPLVVSSIKTAMLIGWVEVLQALLFTAFIVGSVWAGVLLIMAGSR